MKQIEVERIGGIGGFGMPGARIRSRGAVDAEKLSAADARVLEALFSAPPSAPTPMPDAFRYRLTRHTSAGAQTVEVGEGQLPEVVRTAVRDELV